MKRPILFIINPISGGKRKENLIAQIGRNLDQEKFAAEFRYTEYPEHGKAIALEASKTPEKIVVAVGGDGTINEIASALSGTATVMGILPFGSGNGLARTLGIPLTIPSAIKRLNNLDVTCIDAGKVNGRL